jgi:hypothetical protein
MAVLAHYLYDRFSVEGGRSPSEKRPSQKGGLLPLVPTHWKAAMRKIALKNSA